MKGKSAGKTGKIMQVLPEDNKVVVEGLNVIIKHMKPQRRNEKGQRLEFSAPLAIANVQLVCPKCTKITRVTYKVLTAGNKQRVCVKCKEAL